MNETPVESTPKHRPYAHIFSAEDLIETANALGSYFFSVDTMRWFNSRVSNEVRVAESLERRQIMEGHPETEPVRIEVLFITSERAVRSAWDGKRRYTLRKATVLPHKGERADEGDFIFFDTLGEFGQFETLKQAKTALRQTPSSEWTNLDTMKEVAV